MNYWIFKTEPETFSIDDLARLKTTTWDGVRNYQVRNMIRDDIRVGDTVFIYHSNAKAETGIVGTAKVKTSAKPEEPGSTWYVVDISFLAKAKKPLFLEEMRSIKKLAGLRILEKGTRLSITPVSAKHAEVINTAILG